MATNLPTSPSKDSAYETLSSINNNNIQTAFNAVEVDATISFFLKNGFSRDAATEVATVLLAQAKLENVSVFTILDSMETASGVELSIFVSQVLNNSRVQTSVLGFRHSIEPTNLTRNILA
jgi:hypothetical protein